MPLAFDRVDALPMGTMLHGHKVLSTIGAGAFGITYLVEHVAEGTQHVIKEYMPGSSLRLPDSQTVSPKSKQDEKLFEWGLNAFIDEADLLYHLDHNNVVKVTESFRKNGTAYFVMPYVPGITLGDWIKSHPNPTESALEEIFIPLLEALKYLHEKKFLHRDIKPANIIVGFDGNPILIDFGAARLAIGQKSMALSEVLTEHFAPFEQYSSKGTFTPALDFYSLAACLYLTISGKLPEKSPDRVIDDVQIPLTKMTFNEQYSDSFLQVVDKNMNIFAKDRSQTALEFQEMLLGVAGHSESSPITPKTAETSSQDTLRITGFWPRLWFHFMGVTTLLFFALLISGFDIKSADIGALVVISLMPALYVYLYIQIIRLTRKGDNAGLILITPKIRFFRGFSTILMVLAMAFSMWAVSDEFQLLRGEGMAVVLTVDVFMIWCVWWIHSVTFAVFLERE